MKIYIKQRKKMINVMSLFRYHATNKIKKKKNYTIRGNDVTINEIKKKIIMLQTKILAKKKKKREQHKTK